MAKSETEEAKAATDAAAAQAEADSKAAADAQAAAAAADEAQAQADARAALPKSGKEKRITLLSIHTGVDGSINPGTTVDMDEEEADRLIDLKAAVLAAEGAEVSNG